MEKIRWKKYGGGTFRLASGKIIKPNQVFLASPDEIPQAFRDVVKPLEDIPVVGGSNSMTSFRLEHKGAGWFDVINSSTGKKMNDRSLRQEAAQNVLNSLG